MAQFSIREALKFSFSAYAKHLLVCVLAGALVGASWYAAQTAPTVLAEKLGVHVVHEEVTVDLSSPSEQPDLKSLRGTVQSQAILEKAHKVGDIVAKTWKSTPTHHFFLLLCVFLVLWCLYLFLYIGLVKLSLVIFDTGKSSFAAMLSVKGVFFRWLGALGLFVSYLICMVLGMSVLTIPVAYIVHALVGSDRTTAIIAIVVWALFLLCVGIWAVSYMFFGYCIIDNKAQGARESLSMSQALVKGSRFKVVAAFVVMSIISMCIALLVKSVAVLAGFVIAENSQVPYMIGSIITMPIGALYLTFIYRKLSAK